MGKRSHQSGFTLIELIIVIVILGVLAVTAAPKFLGLQEDAERGAFLGVASAFKQGVKQVHYVWLIRGNGAAVLNLIEIDDEDAGGDLSVNQFGYPADTRGTSLTLNSEADCLDVWRAVLDTDTTVEGDNSGTYEAVYEGANDCTYSHTTYTDLQVYYNSNSGEVTITTD